MNRGQSSPTPRFPACSVPAAVDRSRYDDPIHDPVSAGPPAMPLTIGLPANEQAEIWFPDFARRRPPGGLVSPPPQPLRSRVPGDRRLTLAQPAVRHCAPLPRWLYGRRLYRYSTDRIGSHGGLRVALRTCRKQCLFRELTMSSTFDTVANIIAETCDIPRDTIKPESHAIDDLGIDSLDFLDIAFAIDKAFGIKLPLEQWTQEVNDGKATTEQYFVLQNLCARIDDLVAAKGA